LVRQRHRPEVTSVALGALVAAQVLISEEVAASEVLVGALAVIVLAGLFPAQVRSRVGHAIRALVGTAIVAGALLAWPLSVQFFGPSGSTLPSSSRWTPTSATPWASWCPRRCNSWRPGHGVRPSATASPATGA